MRNGTVARLALRLVGTSALGILLAGCPSNEASTGMPAVSLTGTGSTFVYPLCAKWIDEFGKTQPGVKINYQPTGSGAGIAQLLNGTVDFGGTDAPLTDDQLGTAGKRVVHIPVTLGAVVATYNLAGLEAPLRFSPEVLADIFLGKIARWDDPRVAEDNPGRKLPQDPIAVTYRSDGSGTTFIFTDYLSKVSPAFRDQVGKGTTVKFPVGSGYPGNGGVAETVARTQGSIGYVELSYARSKHLPAALLRNRAGKWVEASTEGMAAAATSAALDADLRTSIVDAPGDATYPVSGFSWVIARSDGASAEKRKALAMFLMWSLGPGQDFAPDLGYAKLPAAVQLRAIDGVKELGGQPGGGQ